jgi:Na+/H+ antiporter
MTSVGEVVGIFVGLLVAVALLALLARKLQVSYPILFVIGGWAISWIPGLPKVNLNPDLVFLFFLPPLLYPAALFTSWRDFRANLRPISLLAIGLVLYTTLMVAYLAHLFLNVPLSVGFVLGAIISPPDAVAATAITGRLKVPRRIVTILEGESLLNDATALVAYRFAIMAVASGEFSLASAGAQFLLVSVGGIAIGLLVGYLAAQFHRRVDDAPIEITVSLLTPFVAYLVSEQLHASGVLAVVTAGIYLGWRMPELVTFNTRLEGGPVWEMIEFLLNGFVFILIGLELPEALHALSGENISIARLVWDALAISAAVILIRMVWVFPAIYVPRLLSARIRRRESYPNWRHVMIIAWTGMRGVVSLAAALAVPLYINNTPGSAPFPGRHEILFFTFIIILATLVGQGLTLPMLIKWLGVRDDGISQKEERGARLSANRKALQALMDIEGGEPEKTKALLRLRVEYEDHIRQVQGAEPGNAYAPFRLFSEEYERLSIEMLQVERRTILKLRNQDIISDDVLRRIQRDIDLAEARIHRHL